VGASFCIQPASFFLVRRAWFLETDFPPVLAFLAAMVPPSVLPRLFLMMTANGRNGGHCTRLET
jgi:hypothetical protein